MAIVLTATGLYMFLENNNQEGGVHVPGHGWTGPPPRTDPPAAAGGYVDNNLFRRFDQTGPTMEHRFLSALVPDALLPYARDYLGFNTYTVTRERTIARRRAERRRRIARYLARRRALRAAAAAAAPALAPESDDEL